MTNLKQLNVPDSHFSTYINKHHLLNARWHDFTKKTKTNSSMLGGTLFVCFVIQFDDRNQQYSIELIGFQRDFCWIR